MLECILKIKFLLNLSKENTRMQEQASSKFGGAGGGEREVFTSISYSYYILMEYIYPHDVLQRHYVGFAFDNDILMRNWAEFIYKKLANEKKRKKILLNLRIF